MSQRNIAVTLECFVKKDGKYLMLHRSLHKKIMPDVWMAPGGHREFNEGLFECARREILEETGLKIQNIRLKVVGNAYLKDLHTEFYFSLLVADFAAGKLKTTIKDGKFVWLAPKKILKLHNLLAELKQMIPFIFSNSDEVISYKAIYSKGNQMTHFEIEKP
ncbi:NUDIX domain-containing protein [Candidatus Roizmanbacteria bacterium]|nr:NUDIX domain-containing protein [Candidatus Roizmanbacteria bacterium]